MTWKKVFWKVIKAVSFYALKLLFSTIDKDDNGEISREELQEFVKDARKLLSKINAKK